MSFLILAAFLTLSQTISDVRVEGNVRVTDDGVRAHAAVTTEDDLPDAFRRLWDTGLFDDVRFELDEGVLVIHVEEKPVLSSYRFEGEQAAEEELVESLGLRPNQPFGEFERHELQQLAQELLGDTIEVTATMETTDGLVTLVVSLDPVELGTIEEIRFVGNDALSDSELRGAMQSKPKNWTSWITGTGKLHPSELRADEGRLEDLYASRGYLDARVGPISIDRDDPIVTIPVYEGRQYELAGLSVEPGSLLTEEIVADWLPEIGSVYDESTIDAVVSRLERFYDSRGYPGVSVVRERDVVGTGRVEINLLVEEGAFLRVGRITFRGNSRHRDRDLRQFLEIEEADRFDQALVQRSVQSLLRLETIADVVPEVDFTARPGRADIIYHVKEVDRFEYLVGGGLNGVQGGTGNGQFIAKSLIGRGEVWRVDLDLGNRFQNFVAGYRDPSTLGHRLFFSIDFARANLVFPDETSQDTLDLAIRVGGPQGKRWQFLGGFRIAHFTLDTDLDGFIPFLTPYLGERFRTNRASFNVAYNSRNQPVFPTRGTGAQMGVELATGDVEALHARAQANKLVGLSRRHLLSFSARAAAVWPFGKTETEGLPRFERLFLGNENDLRAFAIRGVGPRDAEVVVGGDRLLYGTAEYQFIPHPRLRLVGFFDIGNVWATDFEGLTLPDIRYDAGAEVQFLTPIWNLPFRIGYGFNLDPVLDEDDGRFFFTFAVRF